MNRNDLIVCAAAAGFMALGILGTAQAADAPAKEKCAGIAKAGKNDCATSTNSCSGHVTTDRNAEAWVYLPAGTCEKIAGGRVITK